MHMCTETMQHDSFIKYMSGSHFVIHRSGWDLQVLSTIGGHSIGMVLQLR